MNCTIETARDPQVIAKLNKSIQQLHCDWYPDEFKPFDLASTEAAFTSFLAQGDCFGFVAILADEPVGYVLCFVRKREESAFQYAKTWVELDQIAVQPKHRGKGVAKLLLQQVVSTADEMGIAEIRTDHWEKNSTADALFSENGFLEIKRRMSRGTMYSESRKSNAQTRE